MSKQNNKTFFVLWLINPFISAIYLFKNFKQNTRIAPYLLLSVFFGLSFVVSEKGADSKSYADELKNYHQNDLSLSDLKNSFYSVEGTKLDIYQPLTTWLVSLFTDNAKVLFTIFSLVFGYFWFKSLLLIRSYLSVPLTGLVLAVFLSLALINPIWNINGVRMWTAIMMFFYGILLIHLNNDKKGWYYLLLPLLVHFSLIIAIILYLIYRLIPVKNKTLFFTLYLGTFFLGELNLDVLRDYFEQLPGFAQSRQGYLNQEYIEGLKESQQSLSLMEILELRLAKYSVLVMVILMYLNLNLVKSLIDKNTDRFFMMGLFFASFSNVAVSVSSGGRYVVLSNLVLYTAFLFFLNQKSKIPFSIKKLLTLSLLILIIFNIRTSLNYIGLFFFIGNPVVNLFILDTPIIDIIKEVLS